MMTRKDFEVTAKLVRTALAAVGLGPAADKVALAARDFARDAAKSNSRFCATKFFVACGLTPEGRPDIERRFE